MIHDISPSVWPPVPPTKLVLQKHTLVSSKNLTPLVLLMIPRPILIPWLTPSYLLNLALLSICLVRTSMPPTQRVQESDHSWHLLDLLAMMERGTRIWLMRRRIRMHIFWNTHLIIWKKLLIMGLMSESFMSMDWSLTISLIKLLWEISSYQQDHSYSYGPISPSTLSHSSYLPVLWSISSCHSHWPWWFTEEYSRSITSRHFTSYQFSSS